MMEAVLDVPTQEVIIKDNAMISADGVVFYQVLDAAKAAYEVNHLENAILYLTMTNTRTVMGSMDLDELLSMRDKINASCCMWSTTRLSPGASRSPASRSTTSPRRRDMVESMARQMKAERDKRAQVLETEGLRHAHILKAEAPVRHPRSRRQT